MTAVNFAPAIAVGMNPAYVEAVLATLGISGAPPSNVVDSAPALSAALASVRETGGRLILPPGMFTTFEPIDATNIDGVEVIIDGTGPRTTLINARHSGPIFDCTGSSFLRFQNFATTGNAVSMPTTAFLLARAANAHSAGNHIFDNVHTLGYYSAAALYNYASEIMRAWNCQFTNAQPNAKGVAVTRRNVLGLTSSFTTIATGSQSCSDFLFGGGEINHYADTGTENDALLLDGVSSLVYGGFMFCLAGRSFVCIDASVGSSVNVALRDLMWDGASTDTGVLIAGTQEISRLSLENIYDAGTKPIASGGRVVYGMDGSGISELAVRNVYTPAGGAYRLYECSYSNLDLGFGDELELKHACAVNRIRVNSANLTVDRIDLSSGNAVHYLDTGVLSQLYNGVITWDPGSLASGSSVTSAAIDVEGAALGDFVEVAPPYDLQGLIATAYVSAPGVARITIANLTGGPIDLASGSFKVKVLK